MVRVKLKIFLFRQQSWIMCSVQGLIRQGTNDQTIAWYRLSPILRRRLGGGGGDGDGGGCSTVSRVLDRLTIQSVVLTKSSVLLNERERRSINSQLPYRLLPQMGTACYQKGLRSSRNEKSICMSAEKFDFIVIFYMQHGAVSSYEKIITHLRSSYVSGRTLKTF